MGFAKILSGGTDGRYVVYLDYGQATKETVLAALSLLQSQLETDLAAAQVKLDAGRAKEADLAAQIAAQIEALITLQNTLPPGSPAATDDKVIKLLMEQRRQVQIQNDPLRQNVNRIKFDRAATVRNIAYWNNFQATETRSVWCTDFTEDRDAGVYAATMEIPGDSSLIVLAPGARTPTAADGVLESREMMSPGQAYLNAAILPGWAKFLPTYRWGTITAIQYLAETATVALADAQLTGQRLNVNQATTLTDVPIEYMSCNASPFNVDDRVVVQFTGQDWDSPKIVGFLDNPRPCNWVCLGEAGLGPFFNSSIDSIWDVVNSTSDDVQYRVDGGGWNSLTYDATVFDAHAYTLRDESESLQMYLLVHYDTDDSYTDFAPRKGISFIVSDASYRNKVIEIAIYSGSEIVFNVAVLYQFPIVDDEPYFVKTPGGISLLPTVSAVHRLSELTDYTLISEA